MATVMRCSTITTNRSRLFVDVLTGNPHIRPKTHGYSPEALALRAPRKRFDSL